MMSSDACTQHAQGCAIKNKVLHALCNAWYAETSITTSMLVQELQHLLPDLRLTIHTNPALVKALVADTCTTASRLLQLKSWFPSANVSMMVTDRSHMSALVEAYCVKLKAAPCRCSHLGA